MVAGIVKRLLTAGTVMVCVNGDDCTTGLGETLGDDDGAADGGIANVMLYVPLLPPHPATTSAKSPITREKRFTEASTGGRVPEVRIFACRARLPL